MKNSNNTIKAILHQIDHETSYQNLVDKLPYVCMALNLTELSSTGETPFKLWMSHCEDMRLPPDLVDDTPDNLVPSCPRK